MEHGWPRFKTKLKFKILLLFHLSVLGPLVSEVPISSEEYFVEMTSGLFCGNDIKVRMRSFVILQNAKREALFYSK